MRMQTARSLLFCSHCTVIPADKAFYDAGMAAKRCAKEDTKGQYSWSSYAFVYLNRFLDINEMMEVCISHVHGPALSFPFSSGH